MASVSNVDHPFVGDENLKYYSQEQGLKANINF